MLLFCFHQLHCAVNTATTVPAVHRCIGIIHLYHKAVCTFLQRFCNIYTERTVAVSLSAHISLIYPNHTVFIDTAKFQKVLKSWLLGHFQNLAVPTDSPTVTEALRGSLLHIFIKWRIHRPIMRQDNLLKLQSFRQIILFCHILIKQMIIRRLNPTGLAGNQCKFPTCHYFLLYSGHVILPPTSLVLLRT